MTPLIFLVLIFLTFCFARLLKEQEAVSGALGALAFCYGLYLMLVFQSIDLLSWALLIAGMIVIGYVLRERIRSGREMAIGVLGALAFCYGLYVILGAHHADVLSLSALIVGPLLCGYSLKVLPFGPSPTPQRR